MRFVCRIRTWWYQTMLQQRWCCHTYYMICMKYLTTFRRLVRYRDVGAITAEFALVLPCVVLVLIIVFAVGNALFVRSQCQHAAQNVAHAMITHRDSSQNFAERMITSFGVEGTVTVQRSGEVAHLELSCPVSPQYRQYISVTMKGNVDFVVTEVRE